MKVLRYQDHRLMPWKNGGGITREIALVPASDGDGFLWRVSLADIASDGPFSSFPQTDRQIMLLSGAGCALGSRGSAGAPHFQQTISRPFTPFTFPGEHEVDCRLLAGPIRVCNVMTRRGWVRAAIERLDVVEATTIARGANEILLLLIGGGQLGIMVEGTHRGLRQFDSVLLQGARATRADIRPLGDEAAPIVVIRLTQL